jgi:Fe-S cluster assembly protein SufD
VIETYVRQFEASLTNGASKGPEWLRTLRRQAIDRFRQVGFPTTKDEEWRFTPVGPIGANEFSATTTATATVDLATLEPLLFGHPEWPRVVFVDGRHRPELSRLSDLPPGLTIRSWAAALAEMPELVERHLARHATPEHSAFAALNAALVRDGTVIRVQARAVLDEPVHVLFLTTAAAQDVAFHPRILVMVEEGAKVQLVESYLTLAPAVRYWTNTVTEVDVAPEAWVEHSRIQRESEAAYHIGVSAVTQNRASHYRSFSLAMGGAIARHDLQTRLAAPNTEALLYGLYLGRGDQLIDNHTTIYHDQPDCRSWEVYKGVLDDRAHGVFNGKILVRPEAQKTDAKQTNRALLLSDGARVDTKPQLEIFADDVKCTHGATVGQLEESAFFYLQSRGIPRERARWLLTAAFAAEVVAEVASDPVRTALESVVNERLRAQR